MLILNLSASTEQEVLEKRKSQHLNFFKNIQVILVLLSGS